MASTPAAAPPPTNSSASAPPPTNSSASSTSPPAQPSSPSPPPPSPSPPPKSPLPASSLPPPRSPTAAHPPPSSPPPNPSSSSSSSPPPPKSGDVWAPPPPASSKPQSLPSHKPPSSADGSDTPSENRHSGDSGWSLPVVIGVTVGVGILLVLMLVAMVLCCCNNNKKKKPMAMDYYGTFGSNGGFNNGGSLPNWQHAEQRTDYRINLPPPPGATSFSPWHQSPPPPQAYSGGMSSTSSGPHSDGGTGAALPPLSPNLGFSKSSFTFEALSAATSVFSRDNILGQGGFGFVYKGVLPNGVPVAAKQFKSGSGQGEREFQGEVEIISRVHHRHLVSLVGYCIAGAQRKLVYEFVPNNTLEHHLHVNQNPVMNWPTRLKIAVGSAKAYCKL